MNIYYYPGPFEVLLINSLSWCDGRKDQSEPTLDLVPEHKYSWLVSRPRTLVTIPCADFAGCVLLFSGKALK